MEDLVNHPSHYEEQAVLVEPIDVLRTCPFDLGNCIKYIIRAEHKGNPTLDYAKASKYLGWAFDSYGIREDLYQDWYERYAVIVCKFKELEIEEPFVYVGRFMDHLRYVLEQKKGEMSEQVTEN